VLEIIETCIFRDAWDDRDQAFDLYAFRDLLLLTPSPRASRKASTVTPVCPRRRRCGLRKSCS